MENFDIELIYKKIKLHYGLKTNSDLASFLGVKPQAISNSLERNQINWNNIITKCEDMSIDELLGRQLPTAYRATGSETGIPLIPINAMAGAFVGEQVVLELECERYVVPAFKDAEFLITVKGSSMIPKYNSGDIVACKRMPLDTFFQWNKVYVLDTEQGPLIKRIKKGSTADTLTIFSDNPSYEPFELPRTKIYHIALVVGVIRLE